MNSLHQNNELSLQTLSKMMPGAFLWKKDINSIYTELNQDCAELFGINKKRDITGFTDHEIPCKIAEFAEIFRQQDQRVITTGIPIKILEVHVCSKNQLRIMLNTKNPLHDKRNIIVGTFAYCIDITKQVGLVRNYFSQINDVNGITNKEIKLIKGSYILSQGDGDSVFTRASENLDNQILEYENRQCVVAENPLNFKLTKRENTCLFYMVRGKTAKEIAGLLFISKRTVEKHIEHIKNKFNCTTKSQLIEKVIENKINVSKVI